MANQVSQPPITAPMFDRNGLVSRPWAIWSREMYTRTAFKGGNAIDEALDLAEDNEAAINALELSDHPNTAMQMQYIQMQINGLPNLTIDTAGFTVDTTSITTDKVIA